MTVDPELVVPDPQLTLKRGAIAPWAKSTSPYYVQTLEALGQHYKFRLDTPWSELPAEGARRRSCSAPATRRSASPTTTACAPTR